MKNSKIKYVALFILGLVLSFNSCTKLDEVAYDQLIAEKFVPTESDIFRMIGGGYTTLQDLLFTWHGMFDVEEECSDIIVTPARPNGWVDGGVYKAMHMHTWTTTQDHPARIWSNCYHAINLCNKSIFSIETGAIPVAESNKNTTLAEMKVLRALYYLVLIDNFGNVPYSTKYDVPTDYLPEQNTRQQVFDSIVSAVNENLPYLSSLHDLSYYGRINKWTAHTILARLYLNAEIYTGTSKWNECIAECDSVINSGAYQLDSKFSNVFATNNENSPEIIFAVPFDNKTTDRGWFHLIMKTLHWAEQPRYQTDNPPWGGNCAIPQFIDTYNPKDGRLKDTWISGLRLSGTDTLRCTYAPYKKKPLIYTNTLGSIDKTKEFEGYRIGKFQFADKILNDRLANDFPFFRYADILMMKAECLLRTGNAAAAAPIVTEVRSRDFVNAADATVTGAELQMGSSYNYGVKTNDVFVGTPEGGADIQYGRFLDELGWEFAAEAHRRSDLIRFGVFTTKSWFSHVPNGDYRALFPIPQSEISKNPKLQQNTGYY